MFCVIASCDTVVSHSPCKLRVSIQKNKIEAGNWLSRVRERERAERSTISIRRKSQGRRVSYRGWAEPGGGRLGNLGVRFFALPWGRGMTSVRFSSVAQLCPTLCDPMDCSTPGLPVHHQLPKFTQTHVH